MLDTQTDRGPRQRLIAIRLAETIFHGSMNEKDLATSTKSNMTP
jgi:hypothetical protein